VERRQKKGQHQAGRRRRDVNSAHSNKKAIEGQQRAASNGDSCTHKLLPLPGCILTTSLPYLLFSKKESATCLTHSINVCSIAEYASPRTEQQQKNVTQIH
jgi:hypothetical protein